MARQSRNVLFTTTILASFALAGVAQADPKGPSISPRSFGNISSIRPDFSIRSNNALRNVDTGNWRGVIAPPESNDDAKKKKESNKGSNKKKNMAKKATGAVKGASVSSPSSAPIPGVNLGSPAGQKIEALQDKLGIESLDAVQGVAKLPGALGKPDAGGWQPPISPSDPGSAGPAQTLPNPRDLTATDGARAAEARARVFEAARAYVPASRRGDAPSAADRLTTGGEYFRFYTWDAGGGRKIEVRENMSSQGDDPERFALIVPGPNGLVANYDQDGRKTRDHQEHGDGTWTERQYDEDGNVVWRRDGRGAAGTSVTLFPDEPAEGSTGGQPANPARQRGGATDSSGNTISGGTASGQTTPAQQRAATGVSSGGQSSGTTPDSSSSGEKPASTDKPDSSSSGEKPGSGEKADNPDKKTQPVEGGPDYRNYFGEMGVTHPGGRPKQQARGSDDRNIPDPSGVIIVPDGPRTPEELKTMTGNWCDGVECFAPGGGSSPGRHASDFAQPPAGSGAGQISPANPIVPGVVLPGGAGNAPSIIPDKGPTE